MKKIILLCSIIAIFSACGDKKPEVEVKESKNKGSSVLNDYKDSLLDAKKSAENVEKIMQERTKQLEEQLKKAQENM